MELVLGPCVERCGLLEMLISGSGEACMLQSVECVFVCLCLSASLFFQKRPGLSLL